MNPDIVAYRDGIWKKAEEHVSARELSGYEVLQILKEISADFWNAGLDEAWEGASIQDLKSNGLIFDISWMTLFAARLVKK